MVVSKARGRTGQLNRRAHGTVKRTYARGGEDDGAALKAAPASEADLYTSPLAATQWRCKASGAILK